METNQGNEQMETRCIKPNYNVSLEVFLALFHDHPAHNAPEDTSRGGEIGRAHV